MTASMSYSINTIHNVADVQAPQIDAVMEIRLEISEARLSFMNYSNKNQTLAMENTIFHLKQVEWYADAMLLGDQNSEAIYLPLNDDVLRHKTVLVLEDITHLKHYLRSISNGFEKETRDSYKEIQKLFKSSMDKAISVDIALLKNLTEKRLEQRAINYTSLILSIILFVVVVGYFISHRRQELFLMSELNKLATFDELTGVPNRRSFNLTLSNEWNHALRAQYSISLVICDIDCFKLYNDALGHQAGDKCLNAVAEVMTNILQRPVDSVARYGGEEFAFILPFTDCAGAIELMEILQYKLRSEGIPHPDSLVSDYVTLSAGIASLIPNSKHSIEEFISIADQTLYRAKDEGRNRTCYTNIGDTTISNTLSTKR